jgi:lipid-A-disaccharide synthase
MNATNRQKNIWIFAGETSGDRYGAKLTESLNSIYPGRIKISGMGGTAMQKAGVNILVDSTELGVVGIVEVFKHIGTFIKIFKYLVKRAEEERPDTVILIDYPGFNLRFAKQMYKRNISVIWYVTPQVWVWGKKRIPKLAKYCKKMLVIFPFEVDVFKHTELDAEFVGHPLVDFVKKRMNPNIKQNPNQFLILPGSRFTEINNNLLIMLKTAEIINKKHPHTIFKISASRTKIENRIREIVTEFQNKTETSVKFDIVPQSTQLMQESATAIATSGTITVECAIVGLPAVVFNILNPITFFMGKCIALRFTAAGVLKKLFRSSFTMPNIIADKTIYEEFLQAQAKPKPLAEAVERILPSNGEKRQQVLKDIKDLAENQLTFGKENASINAAKAVIRTLEQCTNGESAEN